MSASAESELDELRALFTKVQGSLEDRKYEYRVLMMAFIIQARAAKHTWVWIGQHCKVTEVAVRLFYKRNKTAIGPKDYEKLRQKYKLSNAMLPSVRE